MVLEFEESFEGGLKVSEKDGPLCFSFPLKSGFRALRLWFDIYSRTIRGFENELVRGHEQIRGSILDEFC